MAATVVIARLLTPTDYAIGGLALTVMGFFTVFTAQGFGQALVQTSSLSDSMCNSAFWPMVVGGVGLGALATAFAPWVARFYSQPALVPVIWVLALGLAASTIGSVPNALLYRAMRFRGISLIRVIGGLLAAGLGIGMAWLGCGYWALIVPNVATPLAITAGAFWLSGYRPSRSFRWSEFRALSVFGFSMLGSNLVQYFSDRSDMLIMGRFWSPAAYGHYYFALEQSRQPFSFVMSQTGAVFFPAFSRIHEDQERLKASFLRSTRIFCMFIFPFHVLLIGLADPLLPWLFGDQWRPAVLVFQIFAAFAFVRALASLVPSSLLALNHAPAILAFNVFRAIVTILAVLFLGQRRMDIETTAIVLVVIRLVQIPVFIGYLYKQIHLGWVESWRSLKPLATATIIMAFVFFGIRVIAQGANWLAWQWITVSVIFSLGVFVLLTRQQIFQIIKEINLAVAG
jgi:PST family polysaccharide transporter